MRVLTAALCLVTAYSVSPVNAGKPKPAAVNGQIICNGAAGCRPVKPGCHIEPSNYVGQVEVCGNNKRPD